MRNIRFCLPFFLLLLLLPLGSCAKDAPVPADRFREALVLCADADRIEMCYTSHGMATRTYRLIEDPDTISYAAAEVLKIVENGSESIYQGGMSPLTKARFYHNDVLIVEVSIGPGAILDESGTESQNYCGVLVGTSMQVYQLKTTELILDELWVLGHELATKEVDW